MSITAAPGSFLYYGGNSVMKDRIRNYHWQDTAVGPITRWPSVLVATLDLLLHSDVSMILFWEKEYTTFYNDSFLESLYKNVEPEGMDTNGNELWPDLWAILQPLVNKTLAGSLSRGQEDQWLPLFRDGKRYDSYWNFSYNPIKDSTGSIRGVLVLCYETTGKVLLQHQAEDRKELFDFALEACELGTWDLEPVTMIFQCNAKTKELFGLSADENIDLNVAFNAIHPDDRQRVRDAIDKALHVSSGGKYDIEYTIIDSFTQTEKIVKAKGRAFFNSIGVPVRFSGTLQDVTEDAVNRKRIEKLQQLVERSRDYMSMANMDGYLTYMNAAGRSLVGIGQETDITNHHFSRFYSETQLEEVRNTIIPALESTGQWSGLVKIKHQETAEEIPCFGDYTLIKDPASGSLISRGLALKDLRPQLAARKELEESEKRFRNLVQEAPVATAIYTGREMTIQWANDAMISLWGKEKSVIGKTVREALPELEGQPFHGLLDRVYTTGQMYQATEDPGQLVINGILQQFFFNFSYKPLRDAEGHVYGILNMAIDVSEGVKVKRKLEESERNFRNLIMQAPVGICLLTGDELIVQLANDEYLQLVDRAREDFIGRRIWDVLPEAKDQGFDVLLNQVRQTGEPYFGNEQQLYIVRQGAPQTVYVNFVYEPMFDENNKVEGVMAIVIDITRQVEARKAIEIAEERARIAIESAKLGTYDVNLLTKEVHASQRFNQLFDFDSDKQQENYVSHIHPDDLATRTTAWEAALVTGKLAYECRVRRRDGTISWLEIWGQVYFDEAETPYKIIGIVRDVTEEKRGEQEREKFLSLAHYSRDFIGMCDMNMKTLYVNKAAMEMLEMEDVSQAGLWDCFFKEDHDYLKEKFFPGVLKNGYNEVEIRFRNFKTGEAIWVIYNVFLIRDAKGEPVAMATVSRDITDRKNMERELEKRVKERTEELTRLNQELQQFTYVSSHDLKEPLRKIQLFAGLIGNELPEGNAPIRLYASKVISSASRMSSLLSDLLNYSTLSDLDVKRESISLQQLIDSIKEDIELLVEEKKASFHTDTLPVLYGIPFQLRQLFYNLLINALKFSREGVPPVVRIHATPATDKDQKDRNLPDSIPYYRIEVSDNGIGFEQHHAERIFVVFQRLHARSAYSGNGIGLSLCKKIVENHRGHIHAVSKPGCGSTFIIFLPAANTPLKDRD